MKVKKLIALLLIVCLLPVIAVPVYAVERALKKYHKFSNKKIQPLKLNF